MTPEEADTIIQDALLSLQLGIPAKLDPGYFHEGRFSSVPWVPTYVWRLEAKIWAIELFRGDRVPEATIHAMTETVSIDPNVQPAFFVPSGETYELLLEVCRQQPIALIAKRSDEYEVIFTGAIAVGEYPRVIRIPEWVLNQLLQFRNLERPFRLSLATFSRKYRHLLESGIIDDRTQEEILHKTFLSLLKSDPRFSGDYGPLALLRFFEQINPDRRRDHYFHTFNNFLLGCIAIDNCYPDFLTFRQQCFPNTNDWSIEFTWLLTVLFHDVGYPIQNHQATSEIIYGVPEAAIERAIAVRNDAWNSAVYRGSRLQLVSLYDHLTQQHISSDWSPDPFLRQDHPLDRAFERSFLEHGHGVASSMRMLAGFFRAAPNTYSQRVFLARHIFVSGLSIPLHDWPVRRLLRVEGITKIRTSRFPFASLLMFIDSIQEDRRGKAQDPDILTGLFVNGHTVRAAMDLDLLTPEKRREKQREVRDVKDFLTEDLLQFEYPGGLL